MSVLVAVLLTVGLLFVPAHGTAASSFSAETSVYFSPNGGATEAIVRELGSAQHSIRVQAYSFTSAPIAKALLDAHKRGVKILAVLDKSNQTDKYSAATFLANAGIPVLINAEHAIAHNKVIVIDDNTVLTGSFNFSKAAEEKNAENLLVLKKALNSHKPTLPISTRMLPTRTRTSGPLLKRHRSESTQRLGRFTGPIRARFTTYQDVRAIPA
jgi:phosphatidylserine/phosphatidylglycerophosphate/cardiolipin synthase-like enzyme